MKITYRDQQGIDEHQVCALFSTYATWKVHPRPEEWRQILDNSCAVISAWDGEQLIGLARGISDLMRFAQVVGLLVHPDYRRQGIGRELVTRLLDHPTMQVRGVVLGTPDMNSFYEKLGFICLNDQAYFMVMVRDEFSPDLVQPVDQD